MRVAFVTNLCTHYGRRFLEKLSRGRRSRLFRPPRIVDPNRRGDEPEVPLRSYLRARR